MFVNPNQKYQWNISGGWLKMVNDELQNYPQHYFANLYF
jgi:hypothetical protein